jgi:hypothetical protein
MHVLTRATPADLFETQMSNLSKEEIKVLQRPALQSLRAFWLVLNTAMRHPED